MGNNEDRIITPTMIRTEVADNCCYWGKQFSAEDIGHIAEVADNILINDARFQEAYVNAMDAAIDAQLHGVC